MSPSGADAKHESARSPLTSSSALAQLIDLPLLRPGFSDEALVRGCQAARSLGVACALVPPTALDLAVRTLDGSSVAVGTVIDYPHGFSTTDAKLYAVRDALRRGAKEIDVVMSTNKLVSRHFQYLEMELLQIVQQCREAGASVKVALQSELLSDELHIVACRIAKRTHAAFLAGGTPESLPLLMEHARGRVRLKVARAVASLEEALSLYAGGCDRLTVLDPAPLLDHFQRQLERQPAPSASASPTPVIS